MRRRRVALVKRWRDADGDWFTAADTSDGWAFWPT